MGLISRIYYNGVFGGLGGLIGWMLFGVFGEKLVGGEQQLFQEILGGALLGGIIAYFVVSVDAIRDRSWLRFARLSTYGVLLGAVGGAVGWILGERVNAVLVDIFKIEMAEGSAMGTLLVMVARGLGWTFLGVAIGMSEGIAARSLGKFSYGTLGGAIGGFVGGALFGLFLSLSRTEQGTNPFWAALGCVIMGACIGSLSALVQGVFQPACIKVLRGWQEGREYPLDKVANLIGRDEHADVALFRDMRIEKKHAYIKRIGKRYALYNNSAPPQFTLVNDRPVPHHADLQDGDRIQLGNVVLRFHLRAAVSRGRSKRAAPPPTSAVQAILKH